MLVGLRQRTDVFRMQRFVNEFRGEALIAVLPGVALDELWQAIGIMERTLLGVSRAGRADRPLRSGCDPACRPQ